MPNNVDNYLIVKAPPKIIDKMEEAIKNEKLFETFIPIPENKSQIDFVTTKSLCNLDNSSDEDDDEWVEEWCIQKWGTKWDIYCPEILRKELLNDDEAVIIVKFNTAWDPPITFYDSLSDIGDIEAYYAEYGMSLFGKYKNGDLEEYEENNIPDDFWKYIQKPDDDDEGVENHQDTESSDCIDSQEICCLNEWCNIINENNIINKIYY